MKRCRTCQANIDAIARFCSFCGARFDEQPHAGPGASKTLLIFFAVAIAIGFAFFVLPVGLFSSGSNRSGNMVRVRYQVFGTATSRISYSAGGAGISTAKTDAMTKIFWDREVTMLAGETTFLSAQNQEEQGKITVAIEGGPSNTCTGAYCIASVTSTAR